MSKKHRSRRKMKPYQVKLRIIGIMSIIVSLLVLWLPLPSKAVDTARKTNWQVEFDSKESIAGADHYLDLIRYRGDPTSPPTTPSDPVDQDTVIVANGEIKIPQYAVILTPDATLYNPRIGVDYSGGVFAGKTSLKKADLSEVLIQSSATDTSLKDLFSGCTALESVTFGDTAKISTNDIKNFSGMFRGCAALTAIINLKNFKPTAVSDVSEMFAGCQALETVDLSGFSFSDLSAADASKYLKVFDGCNDLQEIRTPTGIPTGVKIELPYSFRNADDPTDTNDYKELPPVATSIRLVRNNDVQNVTVTPKETVVETGKTIELVVTLDPLYAENGTGGTQTVTLKTSKSGIAEFKENPGVTAVSSDKETATVTLTDGTATVELITKQNSGTKTDGTPDSITINASAKKNNNSSDTTTMTGSCDITIQDKVVNVTGVSVAPKSGSIKLNETTTVTATVAPSGATDQDVDWKAENVDGSTNPIVKLTDNADGTVTVSAAGTLLGDVYIKATTKDGGFTDYATITVTSPYSFVEVVDNRVSSETTNTGYTEGTVSHAPTSSNAYLHINTVTDTTSISKINSDSKLTGLDPKSYFTLSKHNADTIGSGTEMSDDLGTATITMALPGDFLIPSNISKQVKLFAYNGTSVNDISSSMVKTTVGDGGTIGAVRFSVDTAALASTYVLAINPSVTVTSTGFLFHVSDGSTKTTPRATSGLPEKQTADLFLVVKDTPAPTLKPLVDGDSTLAAYSQPYYYDIYLTNQSSLEKPVSPIDFGSIEITLPIPDGVDWQNGKILLVSEYNGVLDKREVPRIVQNTSTGKECVQFTATHFSEHAILYDPTTVYTITTSHSGAGTTATTTDITGTDATPATIPAGADASVTVPIGSNNTVIVTATTPADSGYHFVRWTEGGTEVSTSASYEFTPNVSRTLNAVFEEDSTPTPTPTDTYTVAIDRLPSAGGTASADKNAYQAGETATVTASPAEGYVFRFWADETGAPISQELTTTVTVNGNRRLYAVFDRASDVAGAGRTADAVVNVNVPAINVPAPQVNVPAPQVSVNVPAVNVNIPAINVHAGTGMTHAHAGTSATFHPLAFHRPGNYADMPRTGTVSMYRVMLTIILLMSGTVEVLLSIPAKKKRRMRTG